MPKVDLPLPFEAYIGQLPFIFVSYAHNDGRSVFPELASLHAAGYRIWYDEGIDPGNEWPDEIAKALVRSAFFLVFISKSAVDSQNVRNEIHFALNRKKPFLAVYIEDVTLPPGLELRMGDIQAIMKWRMPDDQFEKKLKRSLPENLHDAMSLENRPSELDNWTSNAEKTLLKFRVLYETIRYEQYQPQRSIESFISDLRVLVNELPPFPPPILRRDPSPIHRQGLLEKLRKYITGEIHIGKPIPDSYRLEPIVSDLAIRPGISSVCWSRREGFGNFPEGEIIPMTFENPY